MKRVERLFCGDGPPCGENMICVEGKCKPDPANTTTKIEGESIDPESEQED